MKRVNENKVLAYCETIRMENRCRSVYYVLLIWRNRGGPLQMDYCPLPFTKEKGDYKIVSVRSSVRPFARPKQYGHHNPATTGPIHSRSSSLEPSWPVDVQRHSHLPMEAT